MSYSEDIYINLGKNIKKYRLNKGISQENLSELLNANLKYIGHVERVERYISLKKLIDISRLLNVSMKELFDFTDLH